MRKYLTLFIFALTPFFFFPYCSEQAKETSYQWSINITNGEYNQPVSEIKLVVDGKEYPIIDQVDAPMENIRSEDFTKKGVPESALMACSGFWAGFEQVLYLTKKEGSIDATLLTFEEGFEDPQVAHIKTINPTAR